MKSFVHSSWKLTLCAALTTLFSQMAFTDQLVVDPNFSPFSSANNMIYIENNLMEAQNRYKDGQYNYLYNQQLTPSEDADPLMLQRPYYQLPSSRRFWKGALRWLELSFFWQPVNSLATVTQHEVFGHGYRIRDLGRELATVTGYYVTPYSGGTHFHYNRKPTLSEELLITIAGVEADAVLAHNVNMQWLQSNQVDGRQSNLQLSSANSLMLYILTLRGNPFGDKSAKIYNSDIGYYARSGHDIASFLVDLNELYGLNQEHISIDGANQLTNLKIKAVSSFFLNPFNYFSLMSIYNYVWYNSAIPVPMIDFKSFKYLPAYELTLTPFGPENVYKNYILVEGCNPFYVYFKQGSFGYNDYYGFGLENQELVRTDYGNFGVKYDMWYQPMLLLGARNIDRHNFIYYSDIQKNLGVGLSFIYRHSIMNLDNQIVFCQLGFKTKGYLPGESVFATPIIKAGIKLKF